MTLVWKIAKAFAIVCRQLADVASQSVGFLYKCTYIHFAFWIIIRVKSITDYGR